MAKTSKHAWVSDLSPTTSIWAASSGDKSSLLGADMRDDIGDGEKV